MTDQKENMKKKFPNEAGLRKEWDELTVQKKILFECRKLNDLLVEVLSVLKNAIDVKS